MPSSVLFTNPVVAQQSMAQDQFALAQRAQDLADRNALLNNIRQSQETAQKYGAQRYQTDAYRDTAQGQNQIGMMNAQTSQQQGGRRLDLDTVIARNNKEFSDKQLETSKEIAKINAQFPRMRAADANILAEKVKQHNDEAGGFNAAAKNAALMVKGAADDLKRADEKTADAGNRWYSGMVGDGAKNQTEVKSRPYSYYYRKALESNPKFSDYVDIDGDKVIAKSVKLVAPNANGVGFSEIDPPATPAAAYPLPPGPIANPAQAKPQPEVTNPAAFIPSLMNANPYPTAAPGTIPSGYTGAAQSPLVMTNRATGRSFKVLGMGGQPVYSQQPSNPAALIPSLSSTNQVPIDWNTNPAYQGQGDMTDWSVQ